LAETQTPNYKWVKPDIGGDASTWGNVLNATTDAIDSTVYANQQAGVPIGAVTMFAGATPPSNWLICDGSSLATTGTYAGLFAAIGYAYGGSGANFNLPNLLGAFPLGAGAGSQINVALGAIGGEANHVLSVTEMAAHAHNISDPTHAHGAYQNAHSHGIVTGGHSHSVSMNDHTHGYSQWNSSGGIAVGISGTSYFQQNIAANTGGASNLSGSTNAVGNLGGNTDTQQPGVGIYAAGTGISVASAGGSAGHNTVPPYVALNFIIRFA
jgi:microcystin-dependent protein